MNFAELERLGSLRKTKPNFLGQIKAIVIEKDPQKGLGINNSNKKI